MVCVMEGTLVGFFSRCFGTFEGELREESKDGVEAELALKMIVLKIFTQRFEIWIVSR